MYRWFNNCVVSETWAAYELSSKPIPLWAVTVHIDSYNMNNFLKKQILDTHHKTSQATYHKQNRLLGARLREEASITSNTNLHIQSRNALPALRNIPKYHLRLRSPHGIVCGRIWNLPGWWQAVYLYQRERIQEKPLRVHPPLQEKCYVKFHNGARFLPKQSSPIHVYFQCQDQRFLLPRVHYLSVLWRCHSSSRRIQNYHVSGFKRTRSSAIRWNLH